MQNARKHRPISTPAFVSLPICHSLGATEGRTLSVVTDIPEWAVQMAERSSNSRLSHFVKHLEEIRKLEKDSIFGAEFGVMRVGGTGVGPGEDVEIQWVDDAVAMAKAEGQRAGWDSAPWEDLLKEMLAVAP